MIAGLTDPQRNKIYAQILLGVATLHGHGITHRDLKPANIMVCQTGVVKIIDLGMSRGHDSATLTAKDTALGTPAYLAPEQLNGQPESASDQWAAGIIGYQMVTVGEECGTLPRLLRGYARVKEQEVLSQVNALAAWLELACVLGSGLLGLMVALLAFRPMISIVERL